MSTSFTTFVPNRSAVEKKDLLIGKAISWLSSQYIIEPEKSDCLWGKDPFGYAFSEGITKWIQAPETQWRENQTVPYGLEVIVGRQIHTSMEGGVDVVACPNCSFNFVPNDWDHIGEWFSEWQSGGVDLLTCLQCQQSHDIHDYIFDPTWGFSDLGFRFWNIIFFHKEFVTEFEHCLGMKLDVVTGQI